MYRGRTAAIFARTEEGTRVIRRSPNFGAHASTSSKSSIRVLKQQRQILILHVCPWAGIVDDGPTNWKMSSLHRLAIFSSGTLTLRSERISKAANQHERLFVRTSERDPRCRAR